MSATGRALLQTLGDFTCVKYGGVAEVKENILVDYSYEEESYIIRNAVRQALERERSTVYGMLQHETSWKGEALQRKQLYDAAGFSIAKKALRRRSCFPLLSAGMDADESFELRAARLVTKELLLADSTVLDLPLAEERAWWDVRTDDSDVNRWTSGSGRGDGSSLWYSNGNMSDETDEVRDTLDTIIMLATNSGYLVSSVILRLGNLHNNARDEWSHFSVQRSDEVADFAVELLVLGTGVYEGCQFYMSFGFTGVNKHDFEQDLFGYAVDSDDLHIPAKDTDLLSAGAIIEPEMSAYVVFLNYVTPYVCTKNSAKVGPAVHAEL